MSYVKSEETATSSADPADVTAMKSMVVMRMAPLLPIRNTAVAGGTRPARPAPALRKDRREGRSWNWMTARETITVWCSSSLAGGGSWQRAPEPASEMVMGRSRARAARPMVVARVKGMQNHMRPPMR
jgi:hypothetical protein